MKSKVSLHIYIVLVCMVFALSCEKPECSQRFESNVQGNFWVRDSLGIEDLREVAIFSAYGIGNEDSLVYDQRTMVSVFALPLSPEFEERSFAVANDSIVDTLTFSYTSRLNLVNTVCGFVPNYTIKKVESTHNFIESVRLENSDVNTDEKNNIRVYLK